MRGASRWLDAVAVVGPSVAMPERVTAAPRESSASARVRVVRGLDMSWSFVMGLRQLSTGAEVALHAVRRNAEAWSAHGRHGAPSAYEDPSFLTLGTRP